MQQGRLKPVVWMGPTREAMRDFPAAVRRDIGFALMLAQTGRKADNAKPLRGFQGAGVLEIVEDHDGDTYRAVYTVRFAGAIYVLHCFQKKSKHGRETPKNIVDLIRKRLKAATDDHEQRIVGES